MLLRSRPKSGGGPEKKGEGGEGGGKKGRKRTTALPVRAPFVGKEGKRLGATAPEIRPARRQGEKEKGEKEGRRESSSHMPWRQMAHGFKKRAPPRLYRFFDTGKNIFCSSRRKKKGGKKEVRKELCNLQKPSPPVYCC